MKHIVVFTQVLLGWSSEFFTQIIPLRIEEVVFPGMIDGQVPGSTHPIDYKKISIQTSACLNIFSHKIIGAHISIIRIMGFLRIDNLSVRRWSLFLVIKPILLLVSAHLLGEMRLDSSHNPHLLIIIHV